MPLRGPGYLDLARADSALRVAAELWFADNLVLYENGKPLPRLPLPVTRELLALGRHHFDVACAVCHGLVGDGESLVARNMSLRAPPSLHLKAQNPDGWFYQVIAQGFGLMPSYASHLTVEERWAVVAYLRALQLSQAARLDTVPPAERARLQQGGSP